MPNNTMITAETFTREALELARKVLRDNEPKLTDQQIEEDAKRMFAAFCVGINSGPMKR